jgi:hypothetical protein
MNKLTTTMVVLLYCSVLQAQVPPYTITAQSSESKGYYFLMPARITPGPVIPHDQIILDSLGELVYYRTFVISNTPGFTVQPNGMISFFQGNQFTLLDSTFTTVDTARCSGYVTDSHDLQILPNGNRLMLGVETVTTDLSSFFLFNHNGSPGDTAAQVRSNIIQEIDSSGTVVFEWHAKDHFAFDDVDENWISNPVNVDWTHCNTVEPDADGNILLSSRHFNEITKINRSDSSIMWRMGGKRNEFTFLNDTLPFYGQHDIRRLQNGNVTLFDNGWQSATGASHFARALEYTLDENAKTAWLTWSYVHDTAMYSKATGNVQRLPDGNTLINYGQINASNVTFAVVDSAGGKVFEIAFDDTLFSYRSFNFQSLPWVFRRPMITCMDSAGAHFLDAGAGHTSYIWNTGATTRFIQVTAADTFHVFVPYGSGGYIRSEKFITDSLFTSCALATGEGNNSWNDEAAVSPNPVSGQLSVSFPDSNAPAALEIFDPAGKLRLRCAPVTPAIDVSGLPAGIYFLRFTGNGRTAVRKLIKD